MIKKTKSVETKVKLQMNRYHFEPKTEYEKEQIKQALVEKGLIEKKNT
jgi:hypothetical protein